MVLYILTGCSALFISTCYRVLVIHTYLIMIILSFKNRSLHFILNADKLSSSRCILKLFNWLYRVFIILGVVSFMQKLLNRTINCDVNNKIDHPYKKILPIKGKETTCKCTACRILCTCKLNFWDLVNDKTKIWNPFLNLSPH